jgi:hypothetical protein
MDAGPVSSDRCAPSTITPTQIAPVSPLVDNADNLYTNDSFIGRIQKFAETRT